MAQIAPEATTAQLTLHVNGVAHAITIDDPRMPLVAVLRERLGLRGTKLSCGHGECGACAVLVDGNEERACTLTVGEVGGRAVTTIEGLGTPERPGPVQASLIAEQATQCGFCLPGMIVSATALLARDPDPSDTAIKTALAHHLCRCGSYGRIVRGVRRAANSMNRRAS